ncbi:MAG: EF-P lysine aminoacylase EpmA [Planctomycetaceae bacterium]
MSDDDSWRPTASLAALRMRAELLHAVREFFRSRAYLEVETPVMSRDVVVDAWLEPYSTSTRWLADERSTCDAHASDVDGTELFLQTSPEFAMKRLLAAGAEAIFQVSRVMRQGELGRLHNPEFTMLEWYRVGDTHHEQMAFTEELVRHVFDRAATLHRDKSATDLSRTPPRLPPDPFTRMTYDKAFERYAGTRVLSLSVPELAALASTLRIEAPASLAPIEEERDAWLNLLLAGAVDPHLGKQRPTFLHDYPASQAALAKIRPDDPPVAERFELYIAGIELCNGYHELTDAAKLRRRIVRQAALRAKEGRRALPAESRLLAAMEAGLPACCGVALGFDRLAMLALGADSLAEVLAFPFERA